MTSVVLANHCPLPKSLTKGYWVSKNNKELLDSLKDRDFLKIIEKIERAYNAVANDIHFDRSNCFSLSHMNGIYEYYSIKLSHYKETIADAKKPLRTLIDSYRKDHAANRELIAPFDRCLADLAAHATALSNICADARYEFMQWIKSLDVFGGLFWNKLMLGIEDFLASVEAYERNAYHETFDHMLASGDIACQTILKMRTIIDDCAGGQSPATRALASALAPLFNDLPNRHARQVIGKYTTGDEINWIARFQAEGSKDMTLYDFIDRDLKNDAQIFQILFIYLDRGKIFLGQLRTFLKSYHKLLKAMPS